MSSYREFWTPLNLKFCTFLGKSECMPLKPNIADYAIGILGGLIVGAMTGMSNAPLTAALIGGFFAAAPILVSMPKASDDALRYARARAQALAICFLFLFPFGLTAGIYIRSTNWFLGTPYQLEIKDLKSIGLDETRSKEILITRLINSPITPQRHAPAFGGSGAPPTCSDLKPEKVSNTFDAVLSKYHRQTAPWPTIAAIVEAEAATILVENPDNQHQAKYAILRTAWSVLCQ